MGDLRKALGKTNRDPAHYGNLIDLLCRNSQDGQTIGLPVGPDASRLIAEVIASAIDTQLRGKLSISGRNASRYIDDYTISSADDQSGESLIAVLRQSAAQFELELNSEKSAIYQTSFRQDTGWKQAARAQIPKGTPSYSAIQHFFYEIGQICIAHPDINVEKFALQNARSALVRAEGWKGIQSNLISAYRRNSSLISFLVEMLILRQVERRDVDIRNVKEFIEHRIPVLAQANRTGEIIWLLFLAIRLNINLPASRLARLFEMENSMVALLVAYANSRRLLQGTIDFQNWDRSLNSAGLRGPMWLYAYESIASEINLQSTATFIEQDPFFSLFLNKKIRFLATETGFTSITTTLRSLRGDNDRMRRLRADFSEDFDLSVNEFDDDEEEFEVVEDIIDS